MGDVIDGAFDFLDDAIRILAAPQHTHELLGSLFSVLKDAEKQKSTPEEIAVRLQKEVPQFEPLAKTMPRDRSLLPTWLAVILAAIQIIQTCHANQPQQQIHVDQVINQIIQMPAEVLPPESQRFSKPSRWNAGVAPGRGRSAIGPGGPSRNAPCPCGSGKKYKKCHGAKP